MNQSLKIHDSVLNSKLEPPLSHDKKMDEDVSWKKPMDSVESLVSSITAEDLKKAEIINTDESIETINALLKTAVTTFRNWDSISLDYLVSLKNFKTFINWFLHLIMPIQGKVDAIKIIINIANKLDELDRKLMSNDDREEYTKNQLILIKLIYHYIYFEISFNIDEFLKVYKNYEVGEIEAFKQNVIVGEIVHYMYKQIIRNEEPQISQTMDDEVKTQDQVDQKRSDKIKTGDKTDPKSKEKLQRVLRDKVVRAFNKFVRQKIRLLSIIPKQLEGSNNKYKTQYDEALKELEILKIAYETIHLQYDAKFSKYPKKSK